MAEVAGSCPWWRRAWARRAICFPARGRARGPSPNRADEDDSPTSPPLTVSWTWLRPGHGSHIKILALKRSSYLWAELAARSRTRNLILGASRMSVSWGTPVHCPSCPEHMHSLGSITEHRWTSFPERRTGGPCTTQACALLRPWFFCYSSATLLADDGGCQGPPNVPAACSCAAGLSVCLNISRKHRGCLTSDHLPLP